MKKTLLLTLVVLMTIVMRANHWVVEDPNQYYGITNITCVVTINGEEQTSTQLELAAFCNNVVRGSKYAQRSPSGRYIFRLACYGDSGDVFDNFMLYDASLDKELDYLICNYTLAYDGDTHGGLSSPVVIPFTGYPSSTYELPIVGYGSNPGGYYLIASPVTVAPANVAGDPQGMTEGNFDLYYFDNSKEDEWINYKNEDGSVNTNFGNITPGKGYLYAREANTELQFSGELYSGTGQFDLAYSTGNPSADMRGWNLVGNPFTYGASVDKDAFYVMNEEGRNDIIVSGETAVAPMQGIFVLATGEGQTVKFTQALQPLDGKVVLNLNRNRGTVIDRAIVRLGEGGTLPKFMLNPENTKIYIEQGGDDYAMVSSNEDEIPVSFKAASNGTYTLNVAVQNAELDYLHLVDNLAGTDTDLLANPNYTFEANTGDYASRFTLVLRTTTGLVEHFAFYNGHNWTISNDGEALIQVVDVMGRILNSKEICGNAEINISQPAGVYMLRLVNGTDVKVQKVVVR